MFIIKYLYFITFNFFLSYTFFFVFFFFFFQAEDGIRDADVTGVQTCALPISASSRRSGRYSAVPARVQDGSCRRRSPRPCCCGTRCACPYRRRPAYRAVRGTSASRACRRRRSEERRVGKEGRARRWERNGKII